MKKKFPRKEGKPEKTCRFIEEKQDVQSYSGLHCQVHHGAEEHQSAHLLHDAELNVVRLSAIQENVKSAPGASNA